MRTESLIARSAVALIVSAVAVLGATAGIGFWQARVSATSVSYEPGRAIDVPADLFSGAERTLLVFVRESCAVCQAEAPNIARVASSLKAQAVPTVVLTGSSEAKAEQLFAGQFGNVRHEHLAFSTLRVKTVPTLVLVDRQGTVLFSQEGRSKTVNVMEELIRRIPSR